MSGWLDEVESLGVLAVAEAFGLHVGKSGPRGFHVQPCPSCAQLTRHTKSMDKRGAVGVSPDGKRFECFQCGEKGGAATFSSLAAFKCRLRKGDQRWRMLKAICTEVGLLGSTIEGRQVTHQKPFNWPMTQMASPQKFMQPEYPPCEDVERLWNASLSIEDDSEWCNEAQQYLLQRGFDTALLEKLHMVKVLPRHSDYVYPHWWPASWAESYRIISRVYDAYGKMRSLQGRSINGSSPKTRWPKGYSSAGLLFADPYGIEFLRGWQTPGHLRRLDSVLISEGLTDTLKCGQIAELSGQTQAVIGIASGFERSFRTVDWPVELRVLVATDDDPAGDQYAMKIRALLANVRDLRRVRWGSKREVQ